MSPLPIKVSRTPVERKRDVLLAAGIAPGHVGRRRPAQPPRDRQSEPARRRA